MTQARRLLLNVEPEWIAIIKRGSFTLVFSEKGLGTRREIGCEIKQQTLLFIENIFFDTAIEIDSNANSGWVYKLKLHHF